jgi:alanyl-tRNA synthetase
MCGRSEKTTKSGILITSTVVDNCSIDELRSVAEMFRSKNPSGSIIIAISAEDDGDKVSIVANVSQDLQSQHNAGKILKALLKSVNGKGGGSAGFAQGGWIGKDKIADAKNWIIDNLS